MTLLNDPNFISDLRNMELSGRAIAKKWGTSKTFANDHRRKYRSEAPGGLVAAPKDGPRILALDLETSPNVAHVWGLWNQNVSIKQLLESTEVICFGARWYGSDEVIFRSQFHHGKGVMLADVHELLDQADAVMGWNSKNFDSKHLNREFIQAGMLPPSPWKELDLMLEVRKKFRAPSNKLDYWAQLLGVGSKTSHTGHEMWIKCLAGDEDAWELMRQYQIQDVDLLIDLFEKLKPWLSNVPAYGLYSDSDGCTNCGSTHLQKRGLRPSGVSVFQQYQCQSCGKWMRGAKRITTTQYRSNL